MHFVHLNNLSLIDHLNSCNKLTQLKCLTMLNVNRTITIELRKLDNPS